MPMAAVSSCLLKSIFLLNRTETSYFSSHLFSLSKIQSLSRPISSSPLKIKTPNQTQQNVIDILKERGLLESLTSENLRSASSPLKVYCGFDPTAESLHLGNLIGIIVLSWFLKCGHSPVALIGGATALIGDPSGKSLERPLLTPTTLTQNTLGLTKTLSSILGPKVTILNNNDWWKNVTLLDFLRDIGRYARVGTMLGKESVKRRLEMSEQGLSFTEFTYQLLQGYDFVHLYENEGVSVQIGGTDQWGNITAGTDLVRKILRRDDAYGLTFPLLLKSDGTKFGKSEEGAVWLSAEMLSAYRFYQFFFGVPDCDVIRFMRILTFLSMEEIEEVERAMGREGYKPNTAQRRLAEEVTRFVHGEKGLAEAINATNALKPGAETKLDWESIEGIAKDVPCCSLSYGEVLSVSVIDLSVSTGLLESKSAARRLLKQGGLYLNNGRVDSEGRKIEEEDIVDGKILLLSAGKKNKMVVRIS